MKIFTTTESKMLSCNIFFITLFFIFSSRLRSCNAFATPSSSSSLSSSSLSSKINIPIINGNNNDCEDTFDIFVKMRTGVGTGKGSGEIVYWTGEGELYEAPSGKMIAKVIGLEVSKGEYINEDHVRIFSRKIFWFRDKRTNEIITNYDGIPVKPIKYDFQVFDFKRGVNEKDPWLVPVLPSVVRSKRHIPCMPITPRIAGSSEQILFQFPLFINLDLPDGRKYQAWEFYDYFVDTSFAENRPPSLAWTRQGSNAPFVTDDCGVMHFHAHRVATFEDLPECLQSLVEKDYSLFRYPPLNMGEVDKLIAEEEKTL